MWGKGSSLEMWNIYFISAPRSYCYYIQIYPATFFYKSLYLYINSYKSMRLSLTLHMDGEPIDHRIWRIWYWQTQAYHILIILGQISYFLYHQMEQEGLRYHDIIYRNHSWFYHWWWQFFCLLQILSPDNCTKTKFWVICNLYRFLFIISHNYWRYRTEYLKCIVVPE